MITHPAVAQIDSLLITPPIATMRANAPTTKHQTGIGSIMTEFFSTILDKNLSPICVLVQIRQNPLSSQREYDEQDSVNSRISAKSPILIHTQEVAGSNPASRILSLFARDLKRVFRIERSPWQ
jgi:hypothetical protein